MRAAALLLVVPLALAGLGCSKPPEDPMAEVRELNRQGKWEESAQRLRALVDEDPENPEANFLLGTALLRNGEAGLAVWPLRKATESPDYRIEAGITLTRALLRGRNTHDAIASAADVLAIEPDNVTALELRGEAYLGISSYANALEDADRVLELDPENVRVLVPRVLALIGLERIEEAEEGLALAREKVEAGGPRATLSIRARVCAATAMFAFEQGDPERAETLYDECLEQFPGDVLVVQQKVEFFDKTRRPERATELLEATIEEHENPQLRAMLAQRMGELGRPEDEERLLREEIERRPSASNWFRLADHYVKREMNEEAVEAFEQTLAATANPSPMLRFAYADTLIQAKQFERARKEADTLADEPPLADLLYGRMLLAQGDPGAALVHFEKGIALWPNNPAARFFAAQAAERVGDFDRAISEYRESLRSNAAHTEAGLNLSRLYEARGTLSAAVDAIGRYARTHPSDPRGYLQTIRLAHRLGYRQLLAEGIRRLSLVPGQLPAAVAEEASLVASDRGPEASLVVFERAPLDLTLRANAPALRELLRQLAALGDHEQARRRIAAALSAHPDEPVFPELQGRVRRAAGADPAAVRESFERAVALDAENAQALAGLAELAAESGDAAAAVALYGRAAAADPEDAGLPYAAARALLAAGQIADAETALEAVLQAHPLHGVAALDLARIAADRGDLDRALDYGRWALALRTPGSVEMLGAIRIGRGEAEQAVALLSQALERDPESASVRYGLGLALAAQGDREGARAAFAAVAETAAPEAEQARSELAKLGG